MCPCMCLSDLIAEMSFSQRLGWDHWSRYVESLIAQEIAAGVPSQRILVGGFSQGAPCHVQPLTGTVPQLCS